MILVTGAAGKTGKAVIRAVTAGGESVRALVHQASQIADVVAWGAQETAVGDMSVQGVLAQAMQGVQSIYHICPNVHPYEVVIGHMVIQTARQHGVERLVYHSVLHPQTELMPHHWLKMRVEERLFESGLRFTILQPAAYMQNLLAYWRQIEEQGLFSVPYPPETRLCLVDLEDVAVAAARVLIETGHDYATYELVGEPARSQIEVADILSEQIGRRVRVEEIPLAVWEQKARQSGMAERPANTLIKMFTYYGKYGFYGNCNVLKWLLGRAPTSLRSFIGRAKKQA